MTKTRAYRVHHWYSPIEYRRLLFDLKQHPNVDDQKPKGIVWNGFRRDEVKREGHSGR